VAKKIQWDLLVNDRQFKKGMKGASKSLGGVEGATKKLASAFALAFGAREIAQFVQGSIDAASDFTESVNAVEVATGVAASGIQKLGRTAATELGLSKTAVNEAAVAFAAFGEKVSLDADISNEFEDFITRATDFASVMNVDVDEALRKFQSGLAGETEPLRKFGIDVSAASTQAFALATGIVEVGGKMTEAEKVQARYGLLMQQTDKFAGDFANTSGELANQLRIQEAEMENASIELGKELLPLQLEWVKFQRNALIPALKGVALATRGAGVAITEFDKEGRGFGELMADNGSTVQQMTDYLAFFNNALRTVAGGALFAFGKGAEDAAEAQRAFNRSFADTRPIFDQYGSGARGANKITKIIRDNLDDLGDSADKVTAAVDKMRKAFSGNLFGDAFSKRQFEQDLLTAGGVGSGQESFATGGTVGGPRGAPRLAVVHGGEQISTPGQQRGSGGPNITVNFNGVVGDPVAVAQEIQDLLDLNGRTGG